MEARDAYIGQPLRNPLNQFDFAIGTIFRSRTRGEEAYLAVHQKRGSSYRVTEDSLPPRPGPKQAI